MRINERLGKQGLAQHYPMALWSYGGRVSFMKCSRDYVLDFVAASCGSTIVMCTKKERICRDLF